MIQRAKRVLKRIIRGNRVDATPNWQSETSKCRPRLAKFCVGYGIDIGPGGDPIVPAAIRVHLPNPYSHVGNLPVQLGGDCKDLYWFKDGVLDYLYSSHVLEDFLDVEGILVEWIRVLKPNGHLIIFCPDEQVYRKHCDATGQSYNEHHHYENFSLQFVKDILSRVGGVRVIHENPLVDGYSWEMVCVKQDPAGTLADSATTSKVQTQIA